MISSRSDGCPAAQSNRINSWGNHTTMRQEKKMREDSRKKAEQQHPKQYELLESRRELLTKRILRLPVWKLLVEKFVGP